jgi:hypothetical protein
MLAIVRTLSNLNAPKSSVPIIIAPTQQKMGYLSPVPLFFYLLFLFSLVVALYLILCV